MLLALQFALSMQKLVDAYVSAPVVSQAHVGVLLTDVSSHRVLAEHDADDAFTPASNMKLLVGSVAMATLGPTFTYQTRVAIDGDTLYLIGGGDAHLTTADLNAAAAAVARANMMTVDHIVVDASHFDAARYAPGWSIDDLPYDYAAPVSAMSLNENTIHIHIAPTHTVGEPVQLQWAPRTSALTVINDARTGPFASADTTDILRPWDEPTTLRITGTYPLAAPSADDFDAAVPDPVAYAGDIFLTALQQHGITVHHGFTVGQTPSNVRYVWTHSSVPLATMLAQMWLPSDNLMAELLLRQLGVFGGGEPGSIAKGALVERHWLQSIGVDPDQVDIADGSGLSIYDRISPRTLVAILTADWNAPWHGDVVSALPVAGETGTLRDSYIGTPAAGNIIAKTGTLKHVRTISGYVRTRTHGMLVFSLLVNDWVERSPKDAADLRALDTTFLSALASS